ncbi:hypothetical protein FEM48_Zijuj03G0195100 [Ziziphus jujuba var. spinosa]|uniref:Uncharacterized protein n=1 Tax=Ziziphus jujuba var. spinosa TaxID=714518 RepID=A0A978VS71_ZIZJJ|nr:hypothetical protein FEM48_Zijuj03G0195100 [Ziziphus jujuba var. spinosa]
MDVKGVGSRDSDTVECSSGYKERTLFHLKLTIKFTRNAGFKGLIPHQLGNLSSLTHLGLQGHGYGYHPLDQAELYVENLHLLWWSSRNRVMVQTSSTIRRPKSQI